MGVLTNLFSFKPLSYKIGLVKTLVNRTFKVNNTWLGFDNDIQKLFVILRKNLYPEHVLNRMIYRYIFVSNNRNHRTFVLRFLTLGGSRV